MKEDMGSVVVEGGELCYKGGFYEAFDLELKTCALIGELSTAEGPFVEDYFLIFVDFHRKVYKIPGGAEGYLLMLTQIESILGTKLESRLFGETSLGSNIMYPKKYFGTDLFEFCQESNKSNMLTIRLARWLDELDIWDV